MPLVTDDDEALVARARAGDRAAFDNRVRRHADGLYAVVARRCARSRRGREVTQEAFLRAWRGLPSFRGDVRAYYEQTLSAEEDARVREHLADCARCRTELTLSLIHI